MGLPDQNVAGQWGGRLLVDRDGAEIGTCLQIFTDDATGLPEWAQADVAEGRVVVPLVDAAEAGDRVRVSVSLSQVSEAPAIDDLGHISPEEEERLYRHYGITASREHSDSLLPVDGPAAEPPVRSQPAHRAEPEPVRPGATDTTATPTGDLGILDAPEATSPEPPFAGAGRGPARKPLAAAVAAVVAAVAAVLFWRRLRRPVPPPTRQEQLLARARSASLVVAARSRQARTAAEPALLRGRRLSSAAARRARVEARAAAERAAVQARFAADRAAVQARAAAEQAAAVTAAVKAARRRDDADTLGD